MTPTLDCDGLSWTRSRMQSTATASRRSPHRAPAPRRYSRTRRRSRPTNSARDMMAWPIDTSSRCGSSRNSTRFSRSRSWPALTPRPSGAPAPPPRRRRERARAPRSGRARTPGRTARCRARRGRRRPRPQADRLRLGSTNRLTRMPRDLQTRDDVGQASRLRSRLPARLARDLARHDRHQRALSGLTSRTSSSSSGRGSPSMLNSTRGGGVRSARAMSRTSSGVMCRRSARGCTVMPATPAADAHVDRVEHARLPPAARIAQRRDLVDVDARRTNSSDMSRSRDCS